LEENINDFNNNQLFECDDSVLIIFNNIGLIVNKSYKIDDFFQFTGELQNIQDCLHNVEDDNKHELIQTILNIESKESRKCCYSLRISKNNSDSYHTFIYKLSGNSDQSLTAVVFYKSNVLNLFSENPNKEQNQYIHYFKNFSDGILILDENLNIIESNESFARNLGYSLDEINHLKFSSLLVPLSFERVNGTIARLVKEQHIHFEIEHYHKQGHILTFDVTSSIIRMNNRILTLFLYRDFSGRVEIEGALRESEKKYKSIINNLVDVYYRTDADGKLIMVSPSSINMFGYMSMDEILGRPIETVYPRKEERQEFMEILLKTGRIKNYRTSLLKNDGSIIYVETTSNILFDKNGRFNGVEGIVRDISDRLQAEKSLKESEQSLREINSTKDKLFSIIAHDLKSPFTSIIGFSEMIAENIESLDKNDIIKFVKHIEKSAKNTLSLLENLLIWAKTQTGQMVYNPIFLNFTDVLKTVEQVVSPSARIKNITIEYDAKKDIEIFADPNMLQTILRNLISNAIKFTDTGGKVEIQTRTTEQFVEILISDNGTGMNRKKLDDLFKMEKTSSETGTAKESGSGLGLLICKEFIEKHGGKIWVESEPGVGSKFYFTI